MFDLGELLCLGVLVPFLDTLVRGVVEVGPVSFFLSLPPKGSEGARDVWFRGGSRGGGAGTGARATASESLLDHPRGGP